MGWLLADRLQSAPVMRDYQLETEWASSDAVVTVQRQAVPGKSSLVDRRYGGMSVQQVASAGVSGAGQALPHGAEIQRAFGRHDVSGVRAHVGGAAAEAAGAIGAEAYATGTDVAFTSVPDLHTAAHEAAHVVQQRAGVQLRGGVGEAGDVYERHADDVADRVVAGGSAEDLFDGFLDAGWAGGAAAAVQRSETKGEAKAGEPDTAWARDRRTQIRGLRARVGAMQMDLLSEALATCETLKSARTIFDAFELRHADAAASFEHEVGKHLEAAAKFRESASFLIDTALGVMPQTRIIKAITTAQGIIGKIEGARTLLAARKAAEKEAKETAPASSDAPEGGTPDWKLLVDTAITVFETYVKGSKNLVELDTACDSVIDRLSDVVEGAATDGPASALATQAAALAKFDTIATGGTYAPAMHFLVLVASKLAPMKQVHIEREIAIRWIAALTPKQREAIGECKGYLEGIGAIGARSAAGLGIDVGDWSLDHEEDMVAVRAKVRVEAEDAVGKEARWLGGRRSGGNLIVGRVEYDGKQYSARGPAAPRNKCIEGGFLTTAPGGSVFIEGYVFNGTGYLEETSDWSGTNEKDYTIEMRGQVRFDVQPTETTGNGSVDRGNGPSMSAGDD